jgi:hypothetical protein
LFFLSDLIWLSNCTVEGEREEEEEEAALRRGRRRAALAAGQFQGSCHFSRVRFNPFSSSLSFSLDKKKKSIFFDFLSDFFDFFVFFFSPVKEHDIPMHLVNEMPEPDDASMERLFQRESSND